MTFSNGQPNPQHDVPKEAGIAYVSHSVASPHLEPSQ
jgi:hypothetical protein